MITIEKIKVLISSIVGYFYKWMVEMHLLSIPSLTGGCDIVVSLTSYGRRVSTNVVYYTLVSLLRQKVQPSRIILWLADDEWNDNNISSKLKLLCKKGIEVRYCKDIRSYKKLIPTLELCPDYPIMTVDDDIIYHSDTIARMMDAHRKQPHAILGMAVSTPIIVDGVPMLYKTWEEVPSSEPLLSFPIGYGGTLYPVGSLHPDVISEDLFMKLCPKADDIWFWFCGLMKGTKKQYVPKTSLDPSFDALYQYFHQGSALTHSNRFEYANDKQFRDLFAYYGVKVDDKGNLIKSQC